MTKLSTYFLLLLCFLFHPLSNAATYSIKFFDSSNKVVGSGRFTTDSSSVICVETSFGGNCAMQDPPIDIDFKKNPLTSFSAHVINANWGLDGNKWWAAPGQAPGEQSVSRYGIDMVNNRYFFGDRYFGMGALILDIASATDDSGNGTWSQHQIIDNTFQSASGTWSASIVPLPASLWLFVAGAACIFRRKSGSRLEQM